MSHGTLSKTEFVALMAGLMAVDALAIDIMLPAFPQIGAALGITNPNDRSLIITSFLIGFGPLQLVFGPLTDRFGRKPMIVWGMAAYVLAALACAIAPNLWAMLLARFLQGVATAAVKVAFGAAIRDRYAGQAMADIMSLIAAVFLLIPVVCPTIGQLLLFAGGWQLVFVFMGVVGAGFAVWAGLRLEESLRPADRRSLDFGVVAEGFRIVLGNRSAFAYGICGMFVYGIISNMLNTAQQIYVEIFHLGAWFPVAFAFTTVVASISSLFMGRTTRAFGMRRVAHAAGAIITITSIGFGLLWLTQPPTLWTFYVMLLLVFPCVVAIFTATGALSMEPLGEVAGTAQSVFGAVTIVGGALIGLITAQLYNGTVIPVMVANTVTGLCCLGAYLVAENGKLFGRDQSPVPDVVPAVA